MDLIIVGTIVLAAIAFIAHRAWKTVVASRKPTNGCGDDCGCGH